MATSPESTLLISRAYAERDRWRRLANAGSIATAPGENPNRIHILLRFLTQRNARCVPLAAAHCLPWPAPAQRVGRLVSPTRPAARLARCGAARHGVARPPRRRHQAPRSLGAIRHRTPSGLGWARPARRSRIANSQSQQGRCRRCRGGAGRG